MNLISFELFTTRFTEGNQSVCGGGCRMLIDGFQGLFFCFCGGLKAAALGAVAMAPQRTARYL